MTTNSKSSSDTTFDIIFDPEIANEIFDLTPLKEEEIKEEKEEEEEEEVDEDEECKEISERMENLSMEKWLNLTQTLDKSNSESLEEEASVTLPSIENFINALESYAKMTGRNKPYRRRLNPESNVSVAVEKAFQERISLGMFIMSRITELMRLEKLDCNIFSSGSSNDLRRAGSISKFEPQLKMLVARFARILELGGIKHNIQVCPIARSALLFEEQPKRKRLTEEMSVMDIMKPMVIPEEIKEEVIPEKEKETSNPVEFLKRIVSKYYLTLSFSENPSKMKTRGHEFYSICDLENYSASALGSDRIEARNNSASKMIATLIVEHKKGKSISGNKYTTLTEEEMIKALKILCQTEDYDRQLKDICDEHTAHPPIYKAIRETPMYIIECQALGYKGKGSHTDLTIAKRIAARKVLDVMPKDGILAKHHPLHISERKQRNKTFIIKPSTSYRRRFMTKIK